MAIVRNEIFFKVKSNSEEHQPLIEIGVLEVEKMILGNENVNFPFTGAIPSSILLQE
jgi:hypothetical protein